MKIKLLARAVVFLNSLLEQAGSPAYVKIMKEVYSDGYCGRAMGYVRMEMAIVVVVFLSDPYYFSDFLPSLSSSTFNHRG